MIYQEKEEFKVSEYHYAIPICNIEENGDLQIQLNLREWDFKDCFVELPDGKILSVNTPKELIEVGELYLYWGKNGRLYISGNGFEAIEVIHLLIGNRVMVKPKP